MTFAGLGNQIRSSQENAATEERCHPAERVTTAQRVSSQPAEHVVKYERPTQHMRSIKPPTEPVARIQQCRLRIAKMRRAGILEGIPVWPLSKPIPALARVSV